jgi:hypothetical protein
MQSADRGRLAGDTGARRISTETAGSVPRLAAPHAGIIVTNRGSIYARLTDDIVDIVDNVKTAHLRSDAPTTPRRDNVNIVNNVRVSKPRYRPSHRPSRPLNVNALTWLARRLATSRRRRTPEQRGPNYRRLSRYDVGLIRLLHGRPVVGPHRRPCGDRHSGGRSNPLPNGNSKPLRGMVSRLSLAGLRRAASRGAARCDVCGRHSRLTFPDCSGSTVEAPPRRPFDATRC